MKIFRTLATSAATVLAASLIAAPAQAQLPMPQLPPLPQVPTVEQLQATANEMSSNTSSQIQHALNLPGMPQPPAPAAPPAPVLPPAPWAPSQPAPVANGQSGQVWVNTPWGDRRFLIHVPWGYNPANPTPVLVGIPAYQDSSENFRNYSRLRESTAGRDAIIVYPDSWRQSWEGNPTSQSEPGQDIAFIRQVIDRTNDSYNVDRSRIYATGMSTGSGMAAVLGCHASDLFAAVAPVSGAYYDAVDMNCQGNPMAIITVHGMSDEQHAYNGGFRYGLHYYGGRELMERYAARNRCSGARTEFPISGGATKVVAEGCAAATEHIRVPA